MGIAAFKVFMVVDTGRSYPHMPGIGVHHHGKLLEIFETIAPTGVRAHGPSPRPGADGPHRASVLGSRRARLPGLRQGLRRVRRHHLGHRRGAAAATPAGHGHASSTCCTPRPRASWSSCARAKARRPARLRGDQPVGRAAGQRLGQHRAAGLLRALLLGARGRTPSRSGRRSADGTIDLVVTDHGPHTREEKEPGWTDGWKAHTGHAVGPVLRAHVPGRGKQRAASAWSGSWAPRPRSRRASSA